jgi:hypothetical protein
MCNARQSCSSFNRADATTTHPHQTIWHSGCATNMTKRYAKTIIIGAEISHLMILQGTLRYTISQRSNKKKNTSLSRRKDIPTDQYVLILVQYSVVIHIHSRSWFPLPSDTSICSSSHSSSNLFTAQPTLTIHQEYARNALPFTRSAPPLRLHPAARPRPRTAR